MNNQGSATEAIGLAIGHVKTVLLRPFDMGRWVMLGFIAFLAYLGRGGTSFGYRQGLGSDEQVGDSMRKVVLWMMDHRIETAILLFVIFFVLLVISVILQWLQSRATFVYIDCIATNRAELVRPWKEHRDAADSYFFWRLIFGFCCGLVNLLLLLPFIINLITVLASAEE